MASKFRIEGMDKLIKDMKKLEKVPQRHITSSSKKGMKVALKDAKANAPYKTGDLKKGIVLKGERSRYKGKKVYRIVFDRAMNDIFQKKRMVTKKNGTKVQKVTGYYPISQEYGFFARNGRYIPGYRFIGDSLTDNTKKIEKTIVTTMKKKLDKDLKKAGVK